MSPQYLPTNYWQNYQARIVRELEHMGLFDLRRRTGSPLQAFVPTEETPTFGLKLSRFHQLCLGWPITKWILDFLYRRRALALPYNHDADSFEELAFRIAALYGELSGARPLNDLADSCVGNPEHAFIVDGKRYTHTFLYYYCRYATCAQTINFDELVSFVELGPGLGMQAEIVRKAHPHIKVYTYDLPTQAYVCHQYLKTVFNGASVSHVAGESAEINCLPNWEMDGALWERPALFWNAASFGEMEPNVVENYLSIVGPKVDGVYLFQLMSGKEHGTLGEGGVIEQTRFEDYERILSKSFTVSLRSPYFKGTSAYYRGLTGYGEAVWRRKL